MRNKYTSLGNRQDKNYYSHFTGSSSLEASVFLPPAGQASAGHGGVGGVNYGEE